METTLKVGAYEAKDLVTSYVIAKTSAVLIATGAAVTIASAGTLSFGGVMLAGLGMGMVGAGVSVRMQAYTEWETQNGITGSFGSYLTTAGLGFATGFVSGAVSGITGGIAGNLTTKAFASKTMSAAAKYAVKYGVNFGLETVGDAGIQYLTTGEVDWKRALQSGAINTGILGAADGIHAVAMNWKQIKAGVKNFIGDELGAVDISRFKSGTDTVTYRRVQGGAGNQSSQQRVAIDSEGNVYINKKDRNLNISIDNGEHSQYYINNNRPGADIYEFEVPKWLDDMVKEYTIPQAGYKNNPLNQGGSAPKLTDPTTPGTCIEFPVPWIEWIEEYATNGRIISGGQYKWLKSI